MKTEIFKCYEDFKNRDDKTINGVTLEFSIRFPDSLTDTGNLNCWNCNSCTNCISCTNCYSCTKCVGCDWCDEVIYKRFEKFL